MRWLKTLAAALLPASLPALAADDGFHQRALSLMKESPLVDTHIDLLQLLRSLSRHPHDLIPQLATRFPGHVDIPRMRQGHLGAAFFTVWTPCPDMMDPPVDLGADFTTPSDFLRDAVEVLDLILEMAAQHPDDLQLATSAADVRAAFGAGRIASLVGIEGTHFLGNSLGALRVLARLGVRYVTLTHTCHSAFASSNGFGGPMTPAHDGDGLSALGRELVRELNRLGIMVDLSHVSDATARQAMEVSRAPVVWTHSGARAVWDHPRNVPDDILRMVGDGPGKNRGVVQSVFFPPFIGPVDGANVSRVADHIEHVAGIVGKKHVGIGSDFDGMYSSVQGLEDATTYPNLVAEMLSRGWADDEVRDLMGGNILRLMDEVDAVRDELAGELASAAIWEKRTDLPANWGGPGLTFFPHEVQEERAKWGPVHDEL